MLSGAAGSDRERVPAIPIADESRQDILHEVGDVLLRRPRAPGPVVDHGRIEPDEAVPRLHGPRVSQSLQQARGRRRHHSEVSCRRVGLRLSMELG